MTESRDFVLEAEAAGARADQDAVWAAMAAARAEQLRERLAARGSLGFVLQKS